MPETNDSNTYTSILDQKIRFLPGLIQKILINYNMSINDHGNWLGTSQVSSSKIFILATVQCLDSYILKSAVVFILADQVRSTA